MGILAEWFIFIGRKDNRCPEGRLDESQLKYDVDVLGVPRHFRDEIVDAID